jgi:Lon protease-like protein
VGSLVLPIFPLPDLTFFPGTLLPLHVFEARYRAMVTDAIECGRRLAVVRLRPGYEGAYAGKPAVYDVAGAGAIVRAERLPSGRYNIVMRGDWRVRLQAEIPSDTLYRLFVAERLEDRPPAVDVTVSLGRLRAGCRRLLEILARPADLLDAALDGVQPPGIIADRVAAAVLPGVELRQELLETLDVAERLERVVAAVEGLVAELRGGAG